MQTTRYRHRGERKMNERLGRAGAFRLGTLAGQETTMVSPCTAAGGDYRGGAKSPSGSTVVPMSAPHPHSAADLAPAPVLIGIERNLARLRTGADLEFALALARGDDSSWYHSAGERAHRVTGDVNLQGWTAVPTPDWHGLAISHGGVHRADHGGPGPGRGHRDRKRTRL